MRGYEYVEFSRGTARSNPKMIVNEYERIIDEIILNIKKLEPARESVNMTELAEYSFFENPNPGFRNKMRDVHAKFSYEEIQILYHSLKKSHLIYDNLKTKLRLVNNEFNKFKGRFGVHGKY